VETYIVARKIRDPKAGRDAELRLSHHVLSAPLADRFLLSLHEGDLSVWRSALQRGGRAGNANKSPLAPATVARLLNDLRAAMFAAARKSKAPAALLTIITDGLRAPRQPDRARPKQILADAEIRKLVEAAFIQGPDFGALVMVLAATGARMDQVARLTVADFQPAARRLMVPSSRKGRAEKQVTHIAVPLPDDVVVRLRPITAGRPGHEALLLRWHHQQVAGDSNTGAPPRWERVSRKPWSNAAQMTRTWRVTIGNAKLPTNLVPYCLRHSSIVRGLRAGLPVRLVSAVHDTSVAMIEKHYAAFIVDAVEDLLRRAVVPLLSGEVGV
jgi:integrase